MSNMPDMREHAAMVATVKAVENGLMSYFQDKYNAKAYCCVTMSLEYEVVVDVDGMEFSTYGPDIQEVISKAAIRAGHMRLSK